MRDPAHRDDAVTDHQIRVMVPLLGQHCDLHGEGDALRVGAEGVFPLERAALDAPSRMSVQKGANRVFLKPGSSHAVTLIRVITARNLASAQKVSESGQRCAMLAGMRALMACPFCREMFQPSERRTCPTCGLPLARLEDLPAAAVVGDELAEPIGPEDVTLPFAFTGHRRGLLFALALAGLAVFFLPWAHELAPERLTLSGPQLAQRLGTMWSPLVAWFVMVPLVASRRTKAKMRGARVAIAFLAAMSAIAGLTRIFFPPKGTPLDPHIVEWGLGLYANVALSFATLLAVPGFGGKRAAMLTAATDQAPKGPPREPRAKAGNAVPKSSAPRKTKK